MSQFLANYVVQLLQYSHYGGKDAGCILEQDYYELHGTELDVARNKPCTQGSLMWSNLTSEINFLLALTCDVIHWMELLVKSGKTFHFYVMSSKEETLC